MAIRNVDVVYIEYKIIFFKPFFLQEPEKKRPKIVIRTHKVIFFSFSFSAVDFYFFHVCSVQTEVLYMVPSRLQG